MSTEALRDAEGRVIGTLDDQGEQVSLRDGLGRVAGTYDKRFNSTRDSSGRVVGTGNLLTMLLGRDGS